MKTIAVMAVALMGLSSAYAVDFYNDLADASPAAGNGSWDGGVNDLGGNFGLQVGQVFTSSLNGSVTSVEGYFLGFKDTEQLDGVLVQIYNYSGGSVGSLLGQQTVSGSIGSLGVDPVFTSYFRYDVTANVNIGGLVNGSQYLAVIQGQGPDWGFLLRNNDGNLNTLGRDSSSFGYPGGYNTTDWTDMGALGWGSGDALMRVSGSPVPEPATLMALGLGAGYLIRRRRRV